jgi:hypothetical protein
LSKPAPQPATLDPVALARVLVMPGLNELIDAFARIPPGPLRESVIAHAKVIADQYSNAPPEYAAPDPLLAAARAPEPAQIESRAPRASKVTDGPEVEVIKRRKKGQHPQQITAETGIPRTHVADIIREAKAAGVKFPSIRAAKGKPMETKVWHTSLDTMTGQGIANFTAAAHKRGLTPEQYLARKLLAVQLAINGNGYPAIMAATKMDMKTISLWLSNARAAGFDVPYAARPEEDQEPEDAEFEAQGPEGAPEPVQATPEADSEDANVIRPARFFGPLGAIKRASHRSAIEKAASKRGLTAEAYLDLQESVVRQRLAGVSPTAIMANTGEGPIFVKDTIQEGKKRGADYPPCPKGWGVKAAIAAS